MLKEKTNNVILSETKNLIRSFTCVQDDNQRGRSMVEMLGVLAVIGVLSIAGIAGYNTAMNKHQANELINEASKRAIVISMQLASGQTPNLNEFKGTNAKDMVGSSEFSYKAEGTKTFAMTLSGVDAGVCEQMKNILGTNSTMIFLEDCGSDITLRFNKDLKRGGIDTTENYSSNSNTGGNGQEQGTVDACNNTCGSNATCQPAGYCLCNAGYHGNGINCESDDGANSASSCEENFSFGWNGSQCVDCGASDRGSGGSVENACNCDWGTKPDGGCCDGSGAKSDGTCCEIGYGWNGNQCIDCGGDEMFVGHGGDIDTACSCNGATKPDGSCCEDGYGWDGDQCVDCNGESIGSGGTPETACEFPEPEPEDPGEEEPEPDEED